MVSQLPGLRVGLTLDSEAFIRETRNVASSVDRLGQNVRTQTATMVRGFDVAATSLKTMAAGLAAGFSFSAISSATRQAFAWADALSELSDRLGINVEQLQRLRSAAELTNLTEAQLTTGLERFGRKIGDAARGTGQFGRVLKEQNIALLDQDRQLRSVDAVFDDYVDRVVNARSEQEALSLAVAAFGESGAAFVTTMREMRDAQDEFGVLNEEEIERLGRYEDKIIQVSQRLSFEFKRALATTIQGLEIQAAAHDKLGNAFLTLIDDIIGTSLAMETGAPNLLEWEKGLGGISSAAAAAAEQLKNAKDAIALMDLGAINAEEISRRLGQRGAGGLSSPDSDEFRRRQQAAKQAATEAERLAKSRQAAVADIAREVAATQRLITALDQGGGAYRDVQRALEAENAALRAGFDLSTDAGQAYVAQATALANLKAKLDAAREAQERFTAAQFDAFQQMNDEEMGRRVGQREAGGMSAPGFPDDLQQELTDPFKNALEDIQREFTDVFDELAQGTVRSFEDMADSIHGIFTRMSANIATLSLSPRAEDQADFAALAQQIGLSTGGLRALSLAPSAIGLATGLFGNRNAQQGLAIGGAVGGLAGSLFGPVGGLIGATAGSALGGLFGGIFGGGGSRGRDTSGGAGILGAAGLGGTGQAAQFVRTLDRQLVGLMTARQEQIANAALQFAPAVRVKYQTEPSANDLASLARGRIGPTAAAFGLNVGAVTAGTAEEQASNLQTALALMRTIEGFNLGPINAQFRDLDDTFAEMGAEAARLGVSTAGLAEAHQREAEALTRRIQLEQIAVAATVGALTPLNAALQTLERNMQEANAQAYALGLSTANVAHEHKRLAEELVREARAQQIPIAERVGAIGPMTAALQMLEVEMQRANAEAMRLGISTANVAREHKRLGEALVRENQALQDQLALSITDPFEQLMDPLREFLGDLQVGNLNPAGQMQAAQDEFRRIAELARAGSTTAIQQLESAGQAFIAQAERFGASPGGVAARTEVISVVESVMADVNRAQREASAGLEGAIRQAAQRQVDTLRELIDVGRLQIEEIKRLRR